jgi:hypothetical protein
MACSCDVVVDHFRNAAGELTMQWCRYVTDFLLVSS